MASNMSGTSMSMRPSFNFGLEPPPPLTDSPWTEHKAPDGRRYWFNKLTKTSTWEKPLDLKSPAERILSNCAWREFKTDAGKIYYFNSKTKQSVWSKPPELIEAEKQASEAQVAMVLTAVSDQSSETEDSKSPSQSPAIQAVNSSAIEEAMKATLASIELPPLPTAHGSPIYVKPQQPIRNAADSSTTDSSDDDSDESAAKEEILKKKQQRVVKVPEYKTRQDMIEGFKELLRDRKVPSNASWETAVKMISSDPRYVPLKQLNEKKQIFNIYKTQRLKEEKEEQRIRAKKAKEDLEVYLLKCPRMNSTVKYRRADLMFADMPVWNAVLERDRRELFDDVVQQLTKREKEEAKLLRKSNIKLFKEILHTMPNLVYSTTWSEAQQMLLENPRFAEDEELQNMDKEDALICFEHHIRELEVLHEDSKDNAHRNIKRNQRKAREAFCVLLEELHDHGLLTSLSTWRELFAQISADARFNKMLTQPGSTPLDLLKFYIEDLKGRFLEEKKIVKEILKERAFMVGMQTMFEDFLRVIHHDERGRVLDAGNVKLAFESLRDKAELCEKEKAKYEKRKMLKFEVAFQELLRNAQPPIELTSTWESIQERFGNYADWLAIPLESERMRLFRQYLLTLEEVAAQRQARRKNRRKEKKRHKRGAVSASSSDAYDTDKEGKKLKAKKRKRRDDYEDAASSISESADSRVMQPAAASSSLSPVKRFSPPLIRESVAALQQYPVAFGGSAAADEEEDRLSSDAKKEKKRDKKEKKRKREKKKKKKKHRNNYEKQSASEGEITDDDKSLSQKKKRKKRTRSKSSEESEMSEGELLEKKRKLLAQLETK